MWRLAGVHGREVAWRGETRSSSSACIDKARLMYAVVRHVPTSCTVSTNTCHQPDALCAGLEELQPERGLAVLSALLSSCIWALAMPHRVASPLAADRLMHSRPHLADALSTLPHTDAVTSPEQHLVAHAYVPGERKYMAAPPASAAVAADIIAQMAALAGHVMGGPVSTTQPLMEVCVTVVQDLHVPPSVHRGLLEPVVQAGLDSLGAVELRNAIASTFGVSLPATAAFDHPTLSHMAAYVVTSRQLQAASPATERPALPSTETAHPDVSARLRAVVSSTLKTHIADDQPLMEVRHSCRPQLRAWSAV